MDQSRDSALIAASKTAGGNVYSGFKYTCNLSLDAPKFIAKSENLGLAEVRKQFGDETQRPYLPEFLKSNRRQYRVLDQQEEIDGIRCWIIEWPGMDRIAVDPERDFALIRRSYSWAPGKPLRVEVTNSDHRQIKPGLWLPFQQVETYYASIVADPEATWGTPACRAQYRVDEIRFDDVAESLFRVTLPAKTRVFDGVRGSTYIVANGQEDPFPLAVAGLLEQEQSASKSHFWYWLIGIVIASLFAFALTYKYGRRQKALS